MQTIVVAQTNDLLRTAVTPYFLRARGCAAS
jgi:hypothetical protein